MIKCFPLFLLYTGKDILTNTCMVSIMVGIQNYRDNKRPPEWRCSGRGWYLLFAGHLTCRTSGWRLPRCPHWIRGASPVQIRQTNVMWEADSTQRLLSLLNLMYFLQHHPLLKIIRSFLEIKNVKLILMLFFSFLTCKFIHKVTFHFQLNSFKITSTEKIAYISIQTKFI